MPLETAVLDKLLAAPGEPSDTLRAQLAIASVSRREFTGVGFYTHFAIPSGAGVRLSSEDAELGPLLADHPDMEHGAGFLLFVREGIISLLEGYSHGDTAWPDDASQFTFRGLASHLTRR
jgi:hypothetical protein